MIGWACRSLGKPLTLCHTVIPCPLSRVFVEAWNAGAHQGAFEGKKFQVDVTKSPIPRFDLINFKHYLYVGVQFSRGCPFNCEFCDIIELYGRVPRAKSNEQMLAELQTLYEAGHRGHVDFVDDNLIGNRKALKRFLPALIAWQQERKYPFNFSTEASLLPVDHPLLLLSAEPRRLRFTLRDGVWVRLVDVKGALSTRSYAPGKSVVVEVCDEFCEWNNGNWRIGAEGLERTAAHADIRCSVSVLGSVYLGGFTWMRLSEALRLEELRPGSAEYADAVFRSRSAPWCPEIF